MKLKNILTILLIFGAISSLCSCSPEKEYTSTLIYENATNQSVRIIAYRDYSYTQEEWSLLIPQKENRSTAVVQSSRYGIFQFTTHIKLLFNDGRYIVYDKNSSYLESNTNPFNLSIYQTNKDNYTYKLQITETHYNETQ